MARIGIFDSGVGGLTVQRALLEAVPGADTIYLGDTARVPYGTKSAATVTAYSIRNARVLQERGIDLLVVACNTASAVALPALRAALPVPVLGVVEPGARAAAAASRSGRIGVIGTAGTIASGAYERAIRALAPGSTVTAQPCPLFVPLVEEGWLDDEVTEAVVRRYLAPLQAAHVDALVLGCTHYPLLKPLIARVLGPGVTLIDSAEETARELAHVLAGRELAASARATPSLRIVVTDAPDAFLRQAVRFLGEPVERVETLTLA